MTLRQQPISFALVTGGLSVCLDAYGVLSGAEGIGLLDIFISAILVGIVSGVGFHLGQRKSNMSLDFKQVIFASCLSYITSHTLSNLTGIYETSWFLSLVVLFIMSAIVAIRVPEMFNKNKAKK